VSNILDPVGNILIKVGDKSYCYNMSYPYYHTRSHTERQQVDVMHMATAAILELMVH